MQFINQLLTSLSPPISISKTHSVQCQILCIFDNGKHFSIVLIHRTNNDWTYMQGKMKDVFVQQPRVSEPGTVPGRKWKLAKERSAHIKLFFTLISNMCFTYVRRLARNITLSFTISVLRAPHWGTVWRFWLLNNQKFVFSRSMSSMIGPSLF